MDRTTSVDHQVDLPSDFVGPLLENAASYSFMGFEYIKLIQPLLRPD